MDIRSPAWNLFSDRFFELPAPVALADIIPKLADVVFPESPEQLPEYFASIEWEKLKEKIKELLINISEIGAALGLDDNFLIESIHFFVFLHLNTDGKNVDANQKIFTLLTEGVQGLHAILHLIKLQQISDNKKRRELKLLFEKLTFCGPAVATNIDNVQKALFAELHLATRMMMIRIDIVTEIVAQLINEFLKEAPQHTEFFANFEIHYGNLIFNTYGQLLGLPYREDPYIKEIEASSSRAFRASFEVMANILFSPTMIIEKIMDEFDFSQVASRWEKGETNAVKMAVLDEAWNQLQPYGRDLREFRSSNPLLNVDEEGRAHLVWSYQYLICSSLIACLEESGYFVLSDKNTVKYEIEDLNLEIIVVRNQSMYFSYVAQHNEEKVSHYPFIPYFVYQLTQVTSHSKKFLNNLYHFQCIMMMDWEYIFVAIINYFHSKDYKELTETEKLTELKNIISNLQRYRKFINFAPEQWLFFLSKLKLSVVLNCIKEKAFQIYLCRVAVPRTEDEIAFLFNAIVIQSFHRIPTHDLMPILTAERLTTAAKLQMQVNGTRAYLLSCLSGTFGTVGSNCDFSFFITPQKIAVWHWDDHTFSNIVKKLHIVCLIDLLNDPAFLKNTLIENSEKIIRHRLNELFRNPHFLFNMQFFVL